MRSYPLAPGPPGLVSSDPSASPSVAARRIRASWIVPASGSVQSSGAVTSVQSYDPASLPLHEVQSSVWP